METILVWVLVVSSWNGSRNMAEMMGPFADIESCQRVQQSEPLQYFTTKCVQVKLAKKA